MNVLMLSIDDRIFDEGSEVRERLQAYGPLFDSLHVIVFTRRERHAAVIAPNARLYPAPAAFHPLTFLHAYRQGVRILEATGRETVITSQDAFTNLVAFALRRRFKAPVQVQIHTDFLAPSFRSESFKNRIRYFLYRWSVRRADCIRAVSRRIKDSLKSEVRNPKSEITVLPVFVDTRVIVGAAPAFNLRQKYAGRRPIILMVSRLTREKNIGLALDTFAELAKESPSALLVIVGEGPEREHLEFKIQNLELSRHARLEGWQPDLIPYYKGADFLLVTSRYEGYGRMFVEAAAAGLPIVSTDVGIIGELLKPEESVLIFRTPEDGRAALLRLLGDHELRTRLRENARRAVLALPDLPAYLEAYRAALLGCPKR